MTYKKIKNNKIIEGPFIQSALPMEGEYSSNFYEVISRKRKIVDSIPSKYYIQPINANFYSVHYAFFVLQLSKLHTLKYIDMLIEFYDTQAIRIAYSGNYFNFNVIS